MRSDAGSRRKKGKRVWKKGGERQRKKRVRLRLRLR
jgi:hypothetical protein